MIDAPQALFKRVDEWFHPTALVTGPWRPDAMHGGPSSALMGWAIERATEPGEHIARINIDLERPVPLEPLTTVATRRQASRRVGHLEVVIRTQERVVASARVLVLRGEPVLPAMVGGLDEAGEVPGADFTVDPPGGAHPSRFLFHRDAVEHRFVVGGFEISGPATSWLRLRHPVVEGEVTSGLCQLLGVADFGSAISQLIAPDAGIGMINVDVSVALGRAPVGPWFRLDSVGGVNEGGVGLAVTELRDVIGRLGVVTQSQLAHSYPR